MDTLKRRGPLLSRWIIVVIQLVIVMAGCGRTESRGACPPQGLRKMHRVLHHPVRRVRWVRL